MATLRVRYVKAYTDRHGKRRYYYRRPGQPSVALPGEPGSRAFAEAYDAAMAGAPRKIGEDQAKPGSFSALIADYYESGAYAQIKDITRRTYRNTLERFRRDFGEMPVRELTPGRLDAILDAMAHKPGARDTLRKVLRLILKLAVRRGWIKVNPTDGVRLPRKPARGFRAWTEADIAAYEAKWPTGSRERLALALLLYTGQRRSDVVLMGRQHVQGGRIRVKQQKTGAELWIALHSALKAEIAAGPMEHLTFLVTQCGQPFSPAGFTNWFVERAREAGLPEGSTPHGLRKAAARRLAEAGCTPHQIMAVTGHQNLSEVTLYTASADQERLADEAMAKAETRTKVSNPENPVRQNG
jgi:integrase